MFPETDAISSIISDTMKIVFKRRLVDRVLRLWKEVASPEPFPRPDQIEPAMLGADWLNCLVIAVKSPVRLSTFVYGGENLSTRTAQTKASQGFSFHICRRLFRSAVA